MIDVRGIFLMTALASVVCAAALALQSGHRNLDRPRYAWAAGYGLLASGWALMGLRYQIPMALSVVGANLALFSGIACTIVGLDGFVGRQMRFWFVPATAALCLVVFSGLFLAAPTGGAMRIAAAGLLAAAIAGYAAWIRGASPGPFSDGPGRMLLWT